MQQNSMNLMSLTQKSW